MITNTTKHSALVLQVKTTIRTHDGYLWKEMLDYHKPPTYVSSLTSQHSSSTWNSSSSATCLFLSLLQFSVACFVTCEMTCCLQLLTKSFFILVSTQPRALQVEHTRLWTMHPGLLTGFSFRSIQRSPLLVLDYPRAHC